MDNAAKSYDLPRKDLYKLNRIRMVADILDHPELGRKTILVAGTNGKGSVCGYLTDLFCRHGLSVGTYTSPHIVSETERIRINGAPITEVELRSYEERYEEQLKVLTYFERMTMLAFLIFRDREVHVQVLEVGMGGRLDATNISEPDLSIIASIGLDHQHVLGNSLSEIAREKAGIMRAERPVIWSPQVEEVREVLKSQAHSLHAEVLNFGELTPLWQTELREIEKRRGEHQIQNLRLALSAFLYLAKEWEIHRKSVSLSDVVVATSLPCRIQVFREEPPVILDGGHNPQAVARLKTFLDSNFFGQKFEVIFGLMEDKDISAIEEMMRPYLGKIYLPSFFMERQMKPKELAQFFMEKGHRQFVMQEPLKKTLSRLWEEKKPILVFGSFYLAGEALSMLEEIRANGQG